MLDFNQLQLKLDKALEGRTARDEVLVAIQDELRPVARRLLGYVRAPQSEGDCLQAAFLRVLERFDRFKGKDVRQLYKWMKIALRGIVCDRVKALGEFPAELAQPGTSSILKLLEDNEKTEVEKERIKKIIESARIVLDETQRNLIWMRLVLGRPYAEIREQFGFNNDTDAKNAFVKALEFLRFCVSDSDEEVP